MSPFSPKQSQTPQRTPSNTIRHNTPARSMNHQKHPVLNFQRTIGNQAVLRALQIDFKSGGLASTNAGSLQHSFDNTPVFSPSIRGIQRKLTVNTPGDAYEQEADRVAEQVMQMPVPQAASMPEISGHAAGMQRACACGGSCDDCKKQNHDEEHAKVQMKAAGPGNAVGVEAPPIVHEVLRSSGQPLDRTTRNFMEPRFGQDFSSVRVHTDAKAAESAKAVGARAYTVGQNMIFGKGEFTPGTDAGQKLLGHELTHVVQQGTKLSSETLRRSPDTDTGGGKGSTSKTADPGKGVPENLLLSNTRIWPKGLDHDQELLLLAANPDFASREWKRLPLKDQMLVALQMASFYGAPFATQFADIHQKSKVADPDYIFLGKGVGTASDLVKRGYKLAGLDPRNVTSDVEIWFHPSGNRLHRDVSRADKPKQDTTKYEPPEKRPPSGECKEMTDVIVGMLTDQISRGASEEESLTGQKEHLEKMDKSGANYRSEYKRYIDSLQSFKDECDGTADTVETLRHELTEDMKCKDVDIDQDLLELSNLQTWADIELSPMGTQFLKPINLQVKDTPDEGE